MCLQQSDVRYVFTLFSFANCILLATTVTFPWHARVAHAQALVDRAPPIHYNDFDGKERILADQELQDFEHVLRSEFALKNAPDQVIALAKGTPLSFELNRPAQLLKISIYRDSSELRWYEDLECKRCFYRKLTPDEIGALRSVVVAPKIDKLPSLGSYRSVNGSDRFVVGGDAYMFLHLKANGGRRVYIHAPPTGENTDYAADHPLWEYTKLVEAFEKLCRSDNLERRYDLRRPIAGLEVVYAKPHETISAVWGEGEALGVYIELHFRRKP